MRYGIININIKVEIPNDYTTESEIKDFLEYAELPESYIEDSFKIIKVVED